MQYLKICDPHVHLRGQEYPNHEYMVMAAQDCKAVGICAIAEMPNPKPWITSQSVAVERNKKWKQIPWAEGIEHYCHVAMTTDADQTEGALRVAMCDKRSTRILGDKTFYSHSTGALGILDPSLQRWLWYRKSAIGYTGVSIGHFEDEKAFGSGGIQSDPPDPPTHSLYQGEDAELIQVNEQFKNAVDAGFEGTFYVAHVSNPDTAAFLAQAKRENRSFKTVSEITWHHMFLNAGDYSWLGNNLKCNPPIRSKRVQEQLLDHVLRGSFDIIATDHAPHPQERKLDPVSPASGLPGLPFWPTGIRRLREEGISERLLEGMIFRNANLIFHLGLKEEMFTLQGEDYDVYVNSGLPWDKYGYNPFQQLCDYNPGRRLKMGLTADRMEPN